MGTYLIIAFTSIKNKLLCSFFILPSVLPSEHIALLREAIDRAIAVRDKNVAATLDSQDAIADGLILCSNEGKYFFFMHENYEPDIKKIIFSTYMEEIVRGKARIIVCS